MESKEITLADGRYLIFYTFADEAAQVEADAVSAPALGEPAAEESDV